MVLETKTTEQETTSEEQTLGELLETAVPEEPVAEEEEPVAEEGEPKAEAPKTFTEAEVRERILSEANSIAAKSLQSFQKANETLTRKIADMEVANTKRQREADRARLEGAERAKWEEDGIPLPVIEDIQKTQRTRDEFYDKVSAVYEAENAKWETTRNENVNIHLFLKYRLPDGEKILGELKDFEKELGEGNEAEKELKALRASLAKKEPPMKEPKLDSNRLSAPGGRDRSKYTAKDWVREGLTEAKK